MNTYKYRIYYEWQGRTKSDPFAIEKSPEEIANALTRAPFEFSVRLSDRDATVRSEPSANLNEIILVVTTIESEDGVDLALVATLKDWRLFGDRL
ncbi:hypothetical protein [Duganella violaceipulchra]|uniref:Uncharacterized protein n=1 Tax=Duganella violaceipulchra TaxID=2849652 RepID=A0AA41L123_9BURK|nr:hypothetical protein [Duganella violaceicalia]MBV6319993.1 hypothetical protein [Duganella violaceicalia]MCP2010358.1 hypothetical protein [Duganella violaceicalia]